MATEEFFFVFCGGGWFYAMLRLFWTRKGNRRLLVDDRAKNWNVFCWDRDDTEGSTKIAFTLCYIPSGSGYRSRDANLSATKQSRNSRRGAVLIESRFGSTQD